MPELPRNSIVIIFAALCVAGLAALIYFARSAATQSAPNYSTWNTGPEGAKLVFDGLKQAGFAQVSRQFKPVNVEKPTQSTVFFLGVEAWEISDADKAFLDILENAAKRGNNLVLAIEDSGYSYKSDEKDTLIEKRWGIRFVSDKGIFSERPIVDKTWKEMSDMGPNVWQRAFGTGTVTLVAKADRLTNKGIATEVANRKLLYQLVLQHPSVIFEESHLGIHETGSIVGLARHYHLQGLMAGFILLAGLFVWSRSVSFPPAPPAQETAVLGSDTRSMLTELMSRYLGKQLMSACTTEWNRTSRRTVAIQAPAETDPVKAYAQIQESLKEKSQFTI